jgi:hypothetical protein
MPFTGSRFRLELHGICCRSIANRSTWHNRVPHGAFERLERHAGKLARVVLRGLDGSNPVRLPARVLVHQPIRLDGMDDILVDKLSPTYFLTT